MNLRDVIVVDVDIETAASLPLLTSSLVQGFGSALGAMHWLRGGQRRW